MILSVESLYKYYNGEPILKDVSFTVEDRERIGVIGENGSGKSTLLRIITGEEDFDKTPDGKGSVTVSSNMSIGILKQNSGLSSSETIINEMRKPFEKLYAVKDRMGQLEHQMTELSGADLEMISSEYAELSAYFESLDGYRIDVRINTVLNGMGFGNIPRDRVIATLSGGEKTRLALAKLLIESPDLLILDEPTNHLDVATLQWLEDYLKGYKGAILVVSHDRYFLDKLVGRIFEIHGGSLRSYKGNYSAFVVQKKMNTERQSKEYALQQKEIAKLEDFIARHKVRATSAKAAKSKQHALDRMEIVEKPDESVKIPRIVLEYDIVPPKELFSIDGCELSVGEGSGKKLIAENVSFCIRRGEKVAFVGANGAGKTSLLKLIQGLIPHENGRIKWAPNVKTAYFEQEHGYLHGSLSAFEEVQNRYPSMSELMIRKSLASVLLTGEDVFKPISVLSGGEKAKLCFCLMALKRANVLILDEPTNHLDIASMEVLEDAIAGFDGTVILVSHDRYLLSKVASRIIEIDGGRLGDYNGGYDHYVSEKAKLTEEIRTAAAAAAAASKEREQKSGGAEGSGYRSRQQRAQDAQRRQRLSALEKEIEAIETRISELEAQLSDEHTASDYELMTAVCSELEALKTELDEKMELWADFEN